VALDHEGHSPANCAHCRALEENNAELRRWDAERWRRTNEMHRQVRGAAFNPRI